MDDLFNILSSSARINKSNKKKKKRPRDETPIIASDEDDNDVDASDFTDAGQKSRDRTGKRDISESKLQQVHREEIAAFRNSMGIQILSDDKDTVVDPISTFREMKAAPWWEDDNAGRLQQTLLRNIEKGLWKEPTPIQMQSIPVLLQRRDLIGAAPTGSGKSGAFLLPALFLSSAPHHTFYKSPEVAKKSSKKKKNNTPRKGEIRSLILAPSLELAAQLHREVEKLGTGKPGGLTSLLLAKANAAQAIAGQVGGNQGLDVLISTPLRIVDALEKGLKLDAVRFVAIDEADRLLDATEDPKGNTTGSSSTMSFLSQMDAILRPIPLTATRALFSATVTPTVRILSETILRNPVDLRVGRAAGTTANTDIDQKLLFVGNEQGKLLAIRQLYRKGELPVPALIFCQSQERAQALFGELLYDGMRVNVIHAGRSKAAREAAVAQFRKGETWVLIGTDLVARGIDLSAVKLVINYDLPQSGVTYVHRIGRTGRAGRKGQAITFFTESDLEQLRTIANIMRQSGCPVDDWMLQLPRKGKNSKNKGKRPPKRARIDTTPSYDKKKRKKKKKKKDRQQQDESEDTEGGENNS